MHREKEAKFLSSMLSILPSSLGLGTLGRSFSFSKSQSTHLQYRPFCLTAVEEVQPLQYDIHRFFNLTSHKGPRKKVFKGCSSVSCSVPQQHQMQNVGLYGKDTAGIQTLKNSKETMRSVWKEVFST